MRDTRKTTPGLRQLEKYAVRCGGGQNHRMGLGDAALIKDNHVVAAGGVAKAIEAVRAAAPALPLEVECDDLAQVEEALAAGAELILLDNMGLADHRAAVALARAYPSVRLEASGGLRLTGPGLSPKPASTSSPSAPSPTPAPPSTWLSTSWMSCEGRPPRGGDCVQRNQNYRRQAPVESADLLRGRRLARMSKNSGMPSRCRTDPHR